MGPTSADSCGSSLLQVDNDQIAWTRSWDRHFRMARVAICPK